MHGVGPRPRFFGLALGALLLGATFSCSSNSSRSGALSSSPVVGVSSSAAFFDDAPPVVSDLPETKADPRERLLSQAAMELLKEEHLLHKVADDGVSREAFPKYVEALDPLKLFLLQSQYDALAVFDTDMDNELARGDLVLARKGAAMLETRLAVVTKLVDDLLQKPFDFTVDETFETDPKKRAYATSEDDLRARWRQKLKLEVLERLQQMDDLLDAKAHPKPDKAKDPEDQKRADALLEKALKEIPETFELREAKARNELADRYKTTFTRLASTEALRPAEDFINAINAVYDPHTNYLAPSEKANFNIDMTGKLEGIGATLGEQDHYIVIEDLVPGGAAWQQGKLEQGDLILAVAQEGKDPVDVTDMPVDKVVTLIRGKKDTLVTLTVKKSDGTITPITIKRDVIVVEASYARGAVIRLDKAHGDVGYIFLPSFYGELSRRPKPGERNAIEDVRQLLDQLVAKKVNRVIFDIRGNPGGLLNGARGIMGLFIKTGPVVQTQESSGDVKVFSDDDPSVTYDGDLVMMVDRFSASASEILSGAMQDYGRGVIVGTHNTHGKGTVQDVIDLDSAIGKGEALGIYKVTTSEYYRVAGGSTQLRGVTPDVLLPDPTSWVDSDEGTLFHALPWTSIGAADYTPLPHTWDAKALQAASTARTSGDPNFAKVADFGKLMRARKEDTLEPLERTKWLAKHKKETDEVTAANPKLKDLPAVLEVEPLSIGAAVPPTADKKLLKRLDAWQKDLARDPWVVESIHVLEDMQKK